MSANCLVPLNRGAVYSARDRAHFDSPVGAEVIGNGDTYEHPRIFPAESLSISGCFPQLCQSATRSLVFNIIGER